MTDPAAARKVTRALALPGQRRIHMKHEQPRRRRVIVSAIAAMPVAVTVYDAARRYRTDLEARAACLTALVEDLAAIGADTRLVIEQDDSLVGYDNQRLIEAIRATGQRDTLHYEHQRAHAEPLLALPDVAAWCWVRSGEWRGRSGPSSRPVAASVSSVATARVGAKQVSGAATDQAKQVAGTATDQARDLAAQARDRLSEEAAAQNEKAVTGLRALVDELDSMTHHDGDDGVATDLARRGRGYAQSAGDFLDAREPGDLVGELRGFARRRPGAFLAGALVAGIVAGRLTRGVKASTGNDTPAGTGAAGEPARLAAPLAKDRRTTAVDAGDTSAYPPVAEFGEAGGGPLHAPDDDAAGYQAREDDAGVAGARIDPAALPDRDEARP